MTTVITCLGECLIDFMPQEKDGATVGFSMCPGGSILNVAVSLARLGQSAAFACKMGDDYFGRYLRAYIEQEGIDTRFLLTSHAQSTLAFVAMEGGHPAFSFYGNGAADTLLTIAEVPETLFVETGILHFGSISLLSGTTPSAVLAIAERLKGQALLSFDPNIRPDFIQDEQEYRALFQHLVSLTDVLKLSDADLAWVFPGLSIEEGARKLQSQGPALVLVTQGEDGAFAVWDEKRSLQVPSFAVHVVDTVGSGDAFCASFLSGLVEHGITSREALERVTTEDLQAMLRFANGAAALNCTRFGANPPPRAAIEQFLHEQGM